jgi:tellurite resistance protein TerC
MLIWSLFLLVILALLALDLGVLNRKAHVIGPKEALGWTAFWVALALAFNAFIYFFYEKGGWGLAPGIDFSLGGQEAALEFFAAYLLEKSLSLDNIFVIAMLFGFFKIPAIYQHRVLFWGILGALVMRGIMIALGAALIHEFSWITYVFGGILLLTAIKMLVQRDDNFDPEHNGLIRLARRFMPATSDMAGGRFLTKIDGVTHLTPLMLVLLMVETTDLLFAVDSIPAVFAVTQDPFIVFTSNVFAILGLRSLYFALAGLMDKFRYLKISLVFILAYVAVKMLLVHHYPIPIPVTLAVIGGILAVGVGASMVGTSKDPDAV